MHHRRFLALFISWRKVAEIIGLFFSPNAYTCLSRIDNRDTFLCPMVGRAFITLDVSRGVGPEDEITSTLNFDRIVLLTRPLLPTSAAP